MKNAKQQKRFRHKKTGRLIAEKNLYRYKKENIKIERFYRSTLTGRVIEKEKIRENRTAQLNQEFKGTKKQRKAIQDIEKVLFVEELSESFGPELSSNYLPALRYITQNASFFAKKAVSNARKILKKAEQNGGISGRRRGSMLGALSEARGQKGKRKKGSR